MVMFWLLSPGLKLRENLCWLWVYSRGDLHFCTRSIPSLSRAPERGGGGREIHPSLNLCLYSNWSGSRLCVRWCCSPFHHCHTVGECRWIVISIYCFWFICLVWPLVLWNYQFPGCTAPMMRGIDRCLRSGGRWWQCCRVWVGGGGGDCRTSFSSSGFIFLWR